MRKKFHNRPTEAFGRKFDSAKESRRYAALLMLEKAGVIRDLECQPKIPLLVNGVVIGNYIGDFRYYDNEKKQVVVEDVKSEPTKTPVYRLKKKILATLDPPVDIVEV